MSKYKKKKKIRLFIKVLLCLIYLFIICILCFASFKIFEEEEKIIPWNEVQKTNQYSYLEIFEMSEAFAELPKENKQIHFVMEKEETGEWHTYLMAIKKEDYSKYKNIIDYTYERGEIAPSKIKVYGYPVEINNNIKELAIKNITNFVPIENEVVLTNENFEDYLTNTYLDTTLQKTHEFNYFVLTLLLVALALFILLIFTIFDKDKLVDEVDYIIEKDLKKQKKKKTIHKSINSKNNKNSSTEKKKTDKDTIKQKNQESAPEKKKTNTKTKGMENKKAPEQKKKKSNAKATEKKQKNEKVEAKRKSLEKGKISEKKKKNSIEKQKKEEEEELEVI